MSPTPGWYPDPGGDRRLLRYWDGARWSSRTRPAPAAPPGPLGPVDRSSRRRRLVPLAVIALVIAVVAVVASIGLGGRGPRDITDDPPSYSVSGGDDGEPTPSASPSASAGPGPTRTPTPRPTVTARSSTPVDREACERPRENRLPTAEDPERVVGGALSFPRAALPGWNGPITETRTPYGRDTQAMITRIITETDHPWQSSVNVGVVEMPEVTDPAVMARRLLDCITTSAFYTSIDVEVTDREVRAIEVDGRPAVRLDATIGFDHPRLRTKGSRLWIVVVDTGRAEPDRYGFCFAATPVENAEHAALVEQALRGLAVEG